MLLAVPARFGGSQAAPLPCADLGRFCRSPVTFARVGAQVKTKDGTYASDTYDKKKKAEAFKANDKVRVLMCGALASWDVLS